MEWKYIKEIRKQQACRQRNPSHSYKSQILRQELTECFSARPILSSMGLLRWTDEEIFDHDCTIINKSSTPIPEKQFISAYSFGFVVSFNVKIQNRKTSTPKHEELQEGHAHVIKYKWLEVDFCKILQTNGGFKKET